jgi:hypothetical protein
LAATSARSAAISRACSARRRAPSSPSRASSARERRVFALRARQLRAQLRVLRLHARQLHAQPRDLGARPLARLRLRRAQQPRALRLEGGDAPARRRAQARQQRRGRHRRKRLLADAQLLGREPRALRQLQQAPQLREPQQGKVEEAERRQMAPIPARGPREDPLREPRVRLREEPSASPRSSSSANGRVVTWNSATKFSASASAARRRARAARRDSGMLSVRCQLAYQTRS